MFLLLMRKLLLETWFFQCFPTNGYKKCVGPIFQRYYPCCRFSTLFSCCRFDGDHCLPPNHFFGICGAPLFMFFRFTIHAFPIIKFDLFRHHTCIKTNPILCYKTRSLPNLISIEPCMSITHQDTWWCPFSVLNSLLKVKKNVLVEKNTYLCCALLSLLI